MGISNSFVAAAIICAMMCTIQVIHLCDAAGSDQKPPSTEVVEDKNIGEKIIEKALATLAGDPGGISQAGLNTLKTLVHVETNHESLVKGVWRREGFASLDLLVKAKMAKGVSRQLLMKQLEKEENHFRGHPEIAPRRRESRIALEEIFLEAREYVEDNAEGYENKLFMIQFENSVGDMTIVYYNLQRRQGGDKWDHRFAMAQGTFAPVKDLLIQTDTKSKSGFFSSSSSTKTVMVPLESGITEKTMKDLIAATMPSIVGWFSEHDMLPAPETTEMKSEL